MSHPHQITSAAAAVQFILAGNATFTLRSIKTGVRFTFKVTAVKGAASADAKPRFVKVLTGNNNENDYAFVATIFEREELVWSKKSAIGQDAPSFKALKWVWEKLAKGTIPEMLEIWHEGRCGKCGRKLTVPSSLISGLGPECAAQAGLTFLSGQPSL